jgi:hypothetical protein
MKMRTWRSALPGNGRSRDDLSGVDWRLILCGVGFLVAGILIGTIPFAEPEGIKAISPFLRMLLFAIGVAVFSLGVLAKKRNGVEFRSWALDPQAAGEWSKSGPPNETLYPFDRRCAYYFSPLCLNPPDPVFEVVITNRSSSHVSITHVGLVVESVAHDWIGFPAVRTSDLVRHRKLTGVRLDMPELLDVMSTESPDEFPWVDCRKVVQQLLPDPLKVDSGADYTFSMVLSGFATRLPNHCIVRMWARTDDGTIQSDPMVIRSRELPGAIRDRLLEAYVASLPQAMAGILVVSAMQLQIGDQYRDDTGVWEVATRPIVGGEIAYARVRRVGESQIKQKRAWRQHERIVVQRNA